MLRAWQMYEPLVLWTKRYQKYRVIQKDWLNFVRLYFLNYMVCEWSTSHLKEEITNFQIPPPERSPSAQPCRSVSWDRNGYYASQDFAFTQTASLLKLVIPSTISLPRCRLNVETKTKRTLYSSRRLSFNELTNAKNLVLHSSHFALNWRCCTAVR